MDILTLLLIAVGLAMDAFAVSISNGLAMDGFNVKFALKQSAFFGFFQFGMPVIGYFLGSSVSGYIESIDHWAAFILLAVIGVNMLKEAIFGDDEEKDSSLSLKTLLPQAVATSIDALAVGVSIAFLKVNALFASVVIGVTAFIISFIGAATGSFIGKGSKTAEIFGGIILIAIGVKILLEHTMG